MELARRGAKVLINGRDERRGKDALEAVEALSPSTEHQLILASLANLESVEAMARQILERTESLDVLINNAGSLYLLRRESTDGFEKTFAVNHLAHFALTGHLLPRLQEAPEARVITTASGAHHSGKIDFEDIHLRRGYGGQRAYAHSKLANILFTRELARRLKGSSISATSFHPGFVATNLAKNNWFARPFISILFALFGRSPDKGARTAVFLASAPREEIQSGGYYVDETLVRPAPQAEDDEAARRLWDLSEELTGTRYGL
jgi:NAD(P)-dependent dehydrogenase (short-subunit alcohol dehydrogenase family)